jgi:endo-1,4-beta-xylanase
MLSFHHWPAAAILLLLICSTLHAGDGPAVAALRFRLPVPGDILIDHEDPATLTVAAVDGSSNEIIAVPPSHDCPVDKAVRVHIARAYDTPWHIQILSDKTRSAIHKGDTLFLSCYLRAPESTAGQVGLATLYLQTTDGKWNAAASTSEGFDHVWKEVFTSVVAERDYPAGGLQVSVHLGQQKQVVDLAGLVVLDLGPGIDYQKLPHHRITWQGMESDASWRAEAQKRIEKYRMATMAIQVLNSAGKPVPNASVHVQQQTRAFTIGSFAGYRLVEQTPDGQKMREIFRKLFNRATTPIYWADWGWPHEKARYLATAKWLADNHFTIRGHVMFYPGYQFMPAEVVKLKDDPEQMRKRIIEHIDEISLATKAFGFREYDVTNELRDCTEVHKLLGRDEVANWFAEARRNLPDAKLSLNENTILTNGGATKANQDIDLDWYRFLKSKGDTPDVLGFQGHFNENVTAPETVLAILDRFAKETTAELQITEFDINTRDEPAQAAYTRDFLTICFSHPRITGFNMWGIWEGDQWLPNGAFYRKDWSVKPNGKVLEELLTKTWWTNANVTTDGTGKAELLSFLGTQKVSAIIDGKQSEAIVVLMQPGKIVSITIKP